MRKRTSLLLALALMCTLPLFLSTASSIAASTALSAFARKFMLVGNWKANPVSEESVAEFAASYEFPADHLDLMCAPPHVHLRTVASSTQLTVLAQQISEHPPGAFTGEVTAEAARAAGARFTLVGHSERRKLCGESEDVIERKLRRAVSAGLGVILCVGDESRSDDLASVLTRQLEPLIRVISDQKADFSQIAVAYEPVWAIGTGRVPAPAEVSNVLEFLRNFLTEKLGMKAGEAIRLLYGGSVSESNAKSLGEIGNLDGLLVGAASLDAKRFFAIAKEVAAGQRQLSFRSD